MELNIDIESVVAQAVAAALHPDKLQPIITSNVDKAVKEAIDAQFGYRSDFTKLLTEKVATCMPTDFEDMGRMADLMLKTVQEQLQQVQHDFVKQAVEGRLQQMLKQLPPVMKLSELVRMFTEKFSEDYRRDGGDQPTFIVEHADSLDGYWYLYADPSSHKSKYSCRIHLRFKKADDGEHYVCWACQINEQDLSKQKYIGPIFNDEALAFNLYTNQVRIVLDQTDFSDVYYGGEGYDD